MGQSSIHQNSLGGTTLGGAFSILESPGKAPLDEAQHRKQFGIHDFRQHALANKSLEAIKDFQEGLNEHKKPRLQFDDKGYLSSRASVVLQKRVLSPVQQSNATLSS